MAKSGKPTGNHYAKLPPEGKKTVDNFKNFIEVYFKDQKAASEVLLVGQGTVSRYMTGQSPIPQEVASRLVRYLNGKISLQDIYFDYKEFEIKNKVNVA